MISLWGLQTVLLHAQQYYTVQDTRGMDGAPSSFMNELLACVHVKAHAHIHTYRHMHTQPSNTMLKRHAAALGEISVQI